jgi:hypothetical protein
MATSSSNNGSSGSTMASTIALQIQDRALLLASERGLRDAATVVRNQVKIQLDQQMKEHAVLRNKLLSKLRTRHGYELELHRIKAQQEEHETLIQNEEKEAQVLNEKATSMEEVWKESVQELLAPHQAKRRQYQGYLEQRIRKRQRRSTLQQQKLEFWQNRTQGMRRDQEEMLLERVEVTARTEQTDAQEEEQDEQVSSLALQIKATLTKVRHIDH